jgi:hypothetical protein
MLKLETQARKVLKLDFAPSIVPQKEIKDGWKQCPESADKLTYLVFRWSDWAAAVWKTADDAARFARRAIRDYEQRTGEKNVQVALLHGSGLGGGAALLNSAGKRIPKDYGGPKFLKDLRHGRVNKIVASASTVFPLRAKAFRGFFPCIKPHMIIEIDGESLPFSEMLRGHSGTDLPPATESGRRLRQHNTVDRIERVLEQLIAFLSFRRRNAKPTYTTFAEPSRLLASRVTHRREGPNGDWEHMCPICKRAYTTVGLWTSGRGH